MKHNLFRIGFFVMGAFCAMGNAYAVNMLWCMEAADYFMEYKGTCAQFAEENGTELDTTQLSRCNELRNAILQTWSSYGQPSTIDGLLMVKADVLSNEYWQDLCPGCNQYIGCGIGSMEDVPNEPGKQRWRVGTCDMTTFSCSYSYNYRCANGYFGDGNPCTSCAVATGVDSATTDPNTSITSITQCLLRAGNHKDATGDFTLSNTCYYKL